MIIDSALDDFIDTAESIALSSDAQAVKRTLLKLDKALSKNQKLRLKFLDDPLKFIDSEIDIAEDLQTLMSVSSSPELYPELLKLDAVKLIARK